MANAPVTPPEGLHPDSLPPDFDGWDKGPKVPEHPLGTHVAIDYDTGLPIVKRKTADAPEAKQEPKPDKSAESNSDAENAAKKPIANPSHGNDVADKPSNSGTNNAQNILAKGAPVTVNGKSGKVMFVHQEMDIVRVKPDDGSAPITARKSAVKVQPHVVVQSHVRRIPQ